MEQTKTNFYKRNLLFLLFSLIFNFSITPQVILKGELANGPANISELEYLDNAIIETIYEYIVTDGVLNRTEIRTDILQVGSKKSKYFEYATYQIDSVVYKRDIYNITRGEFVNIFNTYKVIPGSSFTVLKDYREKTMNYYDNVFIDYFVYPDSVAIGWQLENDTLYVCGYLCRKARTNFRGRNWTAYYTDEIPVSDGPWKFSGLPGLILKVEDSDKEHIFTAISIRTANSNIYVYKKSLFKTNRERFNKQLKDYRTDAGKIISGSSVAPKDINTGKEITIPKRRLFFNPIELE